MSTPTSPRIDQGEKTPLLGHHSEGSPKNKKDQTISQIAQKTVEIQPDRVSGIQREITIQQTLQLKDGTYVGEVLNGKPHGKGKFTYLNKFSHQFFDGEFKDGFINGKGILKYRNGKICEGKWENGKMNGYGKITFITGGILEGIFVNGNLSGEGKRITVYGDFYEGDFLNGQFHGFGTCKYSNGSVYQGEWQNGTQHGEGCFTSANGDTYTGQFERNRYHGQGVLIKAGTRMAGTWQEGKHLSGQWGSYKVVNGTRQKGMFEDSCCALM
jgi:hypothetical protein